MGKEFDEHSSIQQHHHLFHQKTIIFLPMFCKFSIKDIKLSRRRHHPTLSDEPSSPKVSCMGQVKRNNRITALPTAAAANHHHRYSKLKKLFSGKALLPPATAAATRSGSKSCRSSREVVCVNNVRRLKVKKDGDDGKCHELGCVDVGRLDPPLPVVKKAAPPRDEANLWRRRFDGAALKTLQIQKIHLPNTISSQPTTV